MVTLRHRVGESIILRVDGHEISIKLHEAHAGVAKIDVHADDRVEIVHEELLEEFVD